MSKRTHILCCDEAHDHQPSYCCGASCWCFHAPDVTYRAGLERLRESEETRQGDDATRES
jgi:hypothetical protein